MIQYKIGNLFELLPEDNTVKIIAHIVNSIGAWGSGFVLPLAKAYPIAEQKYRQWHKDGQCFSKWCFGGSEDVRFGLGNVQFVGCINNVAVANMIGQEGVGMDNGNPPIRYSALATCMKNVARVAKGLDAEIHAPKFGAGLAGGNWDFIETLIKECWCDLDIPVTIYSLEEN